MPSVLFVCTANQFRSPLAAACFLKALEEERATETWIIESAGTWAKDGLPAAQGTLQAARQLGLHGLRGHRTRRISHDVLDRYDLIIVMERGHKESISIEFPSVRERLFLLSEIVDGSAYDLPDPGERGIEAGEVERELSLLIARGKKSISQLARSLSALNSP